MSERQAPPVLRFKGVRRDQDSEPWALVVIGWTTAFDEGWEAVPVDDYTLRKWQLEIADARDALREAQKEKVA